VMNSGRIIGQSGRAYGHPDKGEKGKKSALQICHPRLRRPCRVAIQK
jgi:hypothetical protein